MNYGNTPLWLAAAESGTILTSRSVSRYNEEKSLSVSKLHPIRLIKDYSAKNLALGHFSSFDKIGFSHLSWASVKYILLKKCVSVIIRRALYSIKTLLTEMKIEINRYHEPSNLIDKMFQLLFSYKKSRKGPIIFKLRKIGLN